MTITASAALQDGITDAPLGDKGDAISTAREQHGGISDGAAPVTHGHNNIYVDSSITFENYHYWANRSRDFEKHIRTDNVGLAQLGNLLFRGGVTNEPPTADNVQNDTAIANIESNIGQEGSSANEKSGDKGTTGNIGEWSHGITEAEWEQAQRATRTATWGEWGHGVRRRSDELSLIFLTGTIFYLITTDILGPYNVPWAISVGCHNFVGLSKSVNAN